MLAGAWARGCGAWGAPRHALPLLLRGWRAAEAAGGPGCRGLREPFPLDGFVGRDVVLFQHPRAGFFRCVGLFCLGQFAFWLYLAHFAFTSLRDTSSSSSSSASVSSEAGSAREDAPPRKPWPGGLFNLSSMNLGSDKWRFGFTASCLTVGTMILAAGFLYSRRSVSRVLLLRGSQEVTFTTYYLFGTTSSFTVPLRHTSCMSHRSEVAAVIPVKIKGKSFYFLLDKHGEIPNTPLFDITVGAYREL